MDVRISTQGSLLKVKVPKTEHNNKGGGIRGEVSGFSPKSRKRLLELFATLDLKKGCVFITLTYPAHYPNAKRAKNDLRAFFERLRRLQPQCAAIWRLEFQERGAPHFHLLVFNLPFLPKEEIQRWWSEIIDYDRPFTRIELIRDSKKSIGYVAKYVAKPTPEVNSGFNYETYLHAGRTWGCFQKSKLPFGERTAITADLDSDTLWLLKEAAKTVYPALPDWQLTAGFTLFLPDAYQWMIDLIQPDE